MNTATRQYITIGAGAALVLGAFMPWGTIRSGFGQISVSGMEGDGIITLTLGGLIVALAFRLHERFSRIAVAVLAVLSGVVALLAFDGIGSVGGSQYAQVAPGMGLYLTAAAAAVAFIMPLMHADEREQVPA